MKSWTKGRIALFGNADYCSSPLSGQENNLALVDAYSLAGELKKVSRNYHHAFKQYHALYILLLKSIKSSVSSSMRHFLLKAKFQKKLQEREQIIF